jgi:MSHA pilin protein MshD
MRKIVDSWQCAVGSGKRTAPRSASSLSHRWLVARSGSRLSSLAVNGQSTAHLGLRPQAGVTLVELVVAIVVVAIAAASVLGVLTINATRSADAMLRNQSMAIASSYLEEILGRAFDHTAGPATRPDYDDARDYDGLVDNGVIDQNGNAVAGLDQYQVTVTVVQDNSLPSVAAGDTLRVDVAVRDPGGNTVRLSGYKVKPL